MFSSVFGSIYNPTEETIEINGKKISMINACATRMSLALLNANYNLNSKRDFLCQTGKYRGKGIITKIKKMRDYLFESIGSPDIFISTEDEKSPYYGRTRQISEEEVRKIIGYKNGIYLVYRPGAYTDANGHVSLWLKREMNTIDNPDTGVIGELCFWELT